VASILKLAAPPAPFSPGDAVQQFVKNWTNAEFEEFVEDLAELVNRSGISVDAATAVWDRVLELEEAFWPAENESAAPHS
jgi:formylaminopyrimidine deformylase / aminopyrimidine aminohydrolase